MTDRAPTDSARPGSASIDREPAGPLTLENRRQHEAHEALRLDFLEAATALELPRARALFDSLRAAIEAHLAFEEERVLPVLKRTLDAQEGTRDRLDQHVEGDHKILTRAFTRADEVLTDIAAERDQPRRRLVTELDALLLIGRVLEHHTAREDRLVYPLLDRTLPEEERGALVEEMRGLDGA